MKKTRTKLSPKAIALALLILIGLGFASCSTPHHGSGNHRNHMTNSMGG
jgi:hypothetical protein